MVSIYRCMRKEEKAAANSVIATVLKESASGLLNEVNEINKKIIFAKQEKKQNIRYF